MRYSDRCSIFARFGRAAVYAGLLLVLAVQANAESVLITDMNGGPLGRLPSLTRGDETLVPLTMLAKKANWQIEAMGEDRVVTAGSRVVKLRRGNPFAVCPAGDVQLSLMPEEWDGSLWLPVSSLVPLFGEKVARDKTTGSIQIKVIEAATPPSEPVKSGKDAKQESSSSWRLQNVVIDAGHGGKDPGARGLYGLEEKTVTLDIAKRLKTLLQDSGMSCIFTRDGDEFLELRERTKLANDRRGDLFVSIHCNSYRDPNVRGLETYFLKPAKSERAVDAAMRENSVVKLEHDTTHYQDLTEENYILLTMATSQYMKDSESWAVTALRTLAEKTQIQSRQVDQAGFYVLMGASMPAILVECGYLSNPEDAKLLASERGRNKIAEALGESILKMKQLLESSASR